MNQKAGKGTASPPEVIYIIRHGEKPAHPPPAGHGHSPGPAAPFGVDYQGVHDEHSLLPRGWLRSGALAVLFDPARGKPRAGLRTPGTLLSPSYGTPGDSAAHRTHQTIQGLSGRLGRPIVSEFAEGEEDKLAASVVSRHCGVVLICWEHLHIPALARALPTARNSAVPKTWPDDRFDVIWTFTRVEGTAKTRYAFGQVAQRLLSGDTDTVIAGQQRAS